MLQWKIVKRKSPKKKRRWLGLLAILLVGGVVGGVAVYFAAFSWIQNYLRSDACRVLLARQIGNAVRAQCELEPITWSGWNAYSAKASLQPERAPGWRLIEADGLQGSLDLNAARRGVWHVPSISLDWLRVSMGERAGDQAPELASVPSSPQAENSGLESGAPGWIRRWLPTRTEIDEVNVRRFDLKPSVPGTGVAVDAVTLTARPAVEAGAWRLKGDDGRVMVGGVAEPFRLASAVARFDAGAFVLNDAAARWLGDSEVTARGEVPFTGDRGWSFSGRVAGLDLRHVLSESWKPKLAGVVEGDYEVAGRDGTAVAVKGRLRVKSGVVQALPVLERVADFTHTERFRRVVLDEVTGEVEVQGARTRVTKLVLQSNGLARVEGELLIEGQRLDGKLLVGLSPETLRWMPGAQNHVFTEANVGGVPGFVWTRVAVSGTLDAPREDLSNRLLAAMGRAVLLDMPMEVLGTGLDVLGKSGGAGVGGDKAMLDGGRDIIKGASDTVGKGLDVIKEFVPLLPR